jgi:hypothetical protein
MNAEEGARKYRSHISFHRLAETGQELFSGIVGFRSFLIAVQAHGPVDQNTKDQDPDDHVWPMTQNPHSFKDPFKKIADSIKNIGPGDH